MKIIDQNVSAVIKSISVILKATLLSTLFLFSLLVVSLSAKASEEQIEYGKPNKVLDAMDWIVPQSLLGKLLLWNKDIDSHQISADTIAIVRQYLDDNDMKDVKIRVNQYDPKGEWKRLVANKKMGAGWRYSLGTLSVLGYTLVPNRIVGGDHYNPYTNSVNLFSDNFAVALHEAAHAYDQKGRKYQGTYAASYALPGAPLYHEAKSTSNVLSYLEENGTVEQVAAAKKVLYPAYGTYLGSVTDDPTAQVIGVLAGHIVARRSSGNREFSDDQITSKAFHVAER